MKRTLLILLVALCFGAATAQEIILSTPAPSEQVAGEQEQTRHEQEKLAEDARTLPGRIDALRREVVSERLLDQARLEVDSAHLNIEDLTVDQANTARDFEKGSVEIAGLKKREQLLLNPAAEGVDGVSRDAELVDVRNKLQQARQVLQTAQLRDKLLQQRLSLATDRLELAQTWLDAVSNTLQEQQANVRRIELEDRQSKTDRLQQDYLQEAERLRSKIAERGDRPGDSELRLLKTRLEDADERYRLLRMETRIRGVESDTEDLNALVEGEGIPAGDLLLGQEKARMLAEEVAVLDDSLLRKTQYYRQRSVDLGEASVSSVAEEIRIVSSLIEQLGQLKIKTRELLFRLPSLGSALEAKGLEQSRAELLERRAYPISSLDWQDLFEKARTLPSLLYHQVRLSLNSMVQNLQRAGLLRWAGLGLILLLLASVLWLGRNTLVRAIKQLTKRESDTFVRKMLLVLLALVRSNIWGLGIASAVVAAAFWAKVPQPGLGILLTVVLLWAAVKVPVNLAWLLLAAPRVPRKLRRPDIYRQLMHTLIAGGLLAAATMITHLSGAERILVDAMDRVFMLFLLFNFMPALRFRRYVLDMLQPKYRSKFWYSILSLISLVLPLSLLTASLLGLVGYLNLAWFLTWHLLAFLLVLVGWSLMRSLLGDLAVWFKNFAVRHSSFGLLWTQDIIDPLYRLSRVVLFAGAWWVLFKTYGWERGSAVVSWMSPVLSKPMFTLGSTGISLGHFVVALLIIIFVFWLGRWVRSVTYRWIYSRISDLGVRHSLSVFTQYAVIAIGFLIGLRMLGLDLTAFAVFAGAIGVGIGFGMQNIANNFVSGLLLLIERPLRSGDVVAIGSNEGTISRIGIRSLTMETFDNQEVIIPNADVISSAFTNWTHKDSVLRTVLYIGASYDSEPADVEKILKGIIHENPAILETPEPAVLLWEFGDSSINFRVQYYIDMNLYGLLDIRSQLLMSVWNEFKKSGIEIPYPHRDLNIRNWPESFRSPELPDGGPA